MSWSWTTFSDVIQKLKEKKKKEEKKLLKNNAEHKIKKELLQHYSVTSEDEQYDFPGEQLDFDENFE